MDAANPKARSQAHMARHGPVSRPFTVNLSLSVVHLAGTLSCHIGLMLLQHSPTDLGVVTYVAHPAPTYDVSRPFQGNPPSPGPWISTKVVNQIQVQGHRPKWAAHWAFVVVKEPRHFYRDRWLSVLKPDREWWTGVFQGTCLRDVKSLANDQRLSGRQGRFYPHTFKPVQRRIFLSFITRRSGWDFCAFMQNPQVFFYTYLLAHPEDRYECLWFLEGGVILGHSLSGMIVKSAVDFIGKYDWL